MSTGLFLPLQFKVLHLPYKVGATNDLGNEIDEWEDPVEKDVYGWGPPESKTQFTQAEAVIFDGQRYIVDLQLLVPPGWVSNHRDRFRLGSEEIVAASQDADRDYPYYRQVGPTQMYDHNPFGWNPGGAVMLIAASGASLG